MLIKQRWQIVTVVFLAAFCAWRFDTILADEGEFRTWTNAKGQTAVLSLVRLDGGIVVLRGKDAREYRYPLSELSDADRIALSPKTATTEGVATPSLPPFAGRGAEAILRDLIELEASSSVSGTAKMLLDSSLRNKAKMARIEILRPVSASRLNEKNLVARYGKPNSTGNAMYGQMMSKHGRYLRYEWIEFRVDPEGNIVAIGTAFTKADQTEESITLTPSNKRTGYISWGWDYRRLVWSRDSQQVFTFPIGAGGRVVAWNVATRREVLHEELPSSKIRSVLEPQKRAYSFAMHHHYLGGPCTTK